MSGCGLVFHVIDISELASDPLRKCQIVTYCLFLPCLSMITLIRPTEFWGYEDHVRRVDSA